MATLNQKNNSQNNAPEIDRMIHEPARLLILTNLSIVESADYTYLMNQTGLTWGNLSVQISKLEDCGYLRVEKGYQGRKPQTTACLTLAGREAFREYRRTMLQMLGRLPD